MRVEKECEFRRSASREECELRRSASREGGSREGGSREGVRVKKGASREGF